MSSHVVGDEMKIANLFRRREGAVHGAALMIVGGVAAAGIDVVAKALGDSYHVVQMMWFRYVIHLAIAMVAFGPWLKAGLLSTSALKLQLFRAVLILSTTALVFLSVRFLPLAETVAILYFGPLITVMLARPVLRERPGPLTVLAATVGFVGVVATIQPFSGRFGLAALLPLGAALTSSVYLVITRLIGSRDSVPTTFFYTATIGGVLTTMLIPFFWVTPASVADLALLILLGVFGGGAHFMFIKAHQLSEASSLAPLGYLELGFVTLLGVALFDELPNFLSFVGIALIAASGIAVARRPHTADAPVVEA